MMLIYLLSALYQGYFVVKVDKNVFFAHTDIKRLIYTQSNTFFPPTSKEQKKEIFLLFFSR